MKVCQAFTISAGLSLAAGLSLLACSQKSAQTSSANPTKPASAQATASAPGGAGGLQLTMPRSGGACTYDTLQLVVNGQPCGSGSTTGACAPYTYQHNYAYSLNRLITIGGLSGSVTIQATLLQSNNPVESGSGSVQIVPNQTVPLAIQLTPTGDASNTGSLQVQIVEAGTPIAEPGTSDPGYTSTGVLPPPAPVYGTTTSTVISTLPPPAPVYGTTSSTTISTAPVYGTTTGTVTYPVTSPAVTGTTVVTSTPTSSLADDICSVAINDSYTATTGQPAFLCVLNVPGGSTYRERAPSTALGAEAVKAEFCSQPNNHMTNEVFAASFGCVADGIF